MGIAKFWGWFNRHFKKNITKLKYDEDFKTIGVGVDNLMIDLNGIFHPSAQKVYEYGAHKARKSFLNKRVKKKSGLQKQLDVFRDVCATIEKLFRIVKPRKRLILAVDGIAPAGKQLQQRKRRFVSSVERDEKHDFDSCNLTPGTKFMDFLTKYIDWYIRKRISEDEEWRDIEVIFSNEKVPGEGEHTCINFVRKNNNPNESYCLHGLDADLIMLGLSTHMPSFYILRDDIYDKNNAFFVVDIGETGKQLCEMMRWEKDENSSPFSVRSAINDFVFLCFTVGNDFLPHVPSLEIIEGGIDSMLDVYKNMGKEYGHLTKCQAGPVIFRKDSLIAFFGTIGKSEQLMLEDKLMRKDKYFPDMILEGNAVFIQDHYELDMKKYKEEYYETNFGKDLDIEKLCHQYIEGMQWVLTYYTKGCANWQWFFPEHYAPFCSDIVNYIRSYKRVKYGFSKPTSPFLQLLSVLPPKSANLLPEGLQDMFDKKPLCDYCPSTFKVDVSGKKNDWEGIVLLPILDRKIIESEYYRKLKILSQRDLSRNRIGRTYLYTYDSSKTYEYKSFYGNFTSYVNTKLIDL
jgi:5'-3' exonuclease